MKSILLAILTLILTSASHAKQVETSYLSMQMDDRWTCQQSQTEWLCRSRLGTESKEAFIVLKSKLLGPKDNMSIFESTLKAPKNYTGNDGHPKVSRVLNNSKAILNKKLWFKAEHFGGEIDNFNSIYVATTHGDLAILAIFNVHKKKREKYISEFNKIISSFKLKKNIAMLSSGPKTINSKFNLNANAAEDTANSNAPLAIISRMIKSTWGLYLIGGFLLVTILIVVAIKR